MAAGPFLSQRLAQSQTLALTPAMQLKLKLWQMNLQELSQTIERELEDNPLLELSDDSDEIPTLEAIEEGRDSDVTEGSAEQMADGPELPEGVDTVDLGPMLDGAGEMNPESDLEKFTEEGVSQVQETELGAENSWDSELPRTSNLPDEDKMSWEDRLSAFESLQDHLVGQLYETLEHEDSRAPLVERLIDRLDPKGFLRMDPDMPSLEATPAALAADLGVTEEALRAAVEVLQEFDPSGVGCFTVQESLLLQLRHAGAEPDDLAVRIIQDFTVLLSQRDSGKLRKEIGRAHV